MNIRDLFQIATFILAIYCFVGLLIWSLRDNTRRKWAFPALTWIGHTIIFYVFVFLTQLKIVDLPFDLGDWSALLRIHTYIIVGYLVSSLLVLNGKLDGHHVNNRIS